MIDPKLKIKIDKQRIRPIDSEVDRLKCDNKFFIKKSKWKPTISFDQGLNKTIEWIQSQDNSELSSIYNV